MGVFFVFNRGSRERTKEVEGLVVKQRIDEAIVVCQRYGTPLAYILLAALRAKGRSRDQIKTAVEEAGSRESAPLERYLGLLGTIATISPLLDSWARCLG
ncbi:MAG: MotA/TolQ/ExbB proton channel family protein [Syntrophotaleaceae bacterium]